MQIKEFQSEENAGERIDKFLTEKVPELSRSYIQKLIKEKDDIEVILPSHHRYPLTKDYIDYCLEDALALKNGQLPKKPHQTLPCYEYQGKYVQFYYD